MFVLNNLCGFGVGGGKFTLALRGYGYSEQTSGFTGSYSTVGFGSAPNAGSFVIWYLMAYDSGGVTPPEFNLPSGWLSKPAAATISFGTAYYCKHQSLSDISSPPTFVQSSIGDVLGVWIAYDVTNAPADNSSHSVQRWTTGAAGANYTTLMPFDTLGPIFICCFNLTTSNDANVNWSSIVPDVSYELPIDWTPGSTNGFQGNRFEWKLFGPEETFPSSQSVTFTSGSGQTRIGGMMACYPYTTGVAYN